MPVPAPMYVNLKNMEGTSPAELETLATSLKSSPRALRGGKRHTKNANSLQPKSQFSIKMSTQNAGQVRRECTREQMEVTLGAKDARKSFYTERSYQDELLESFSGSGGAGDAALTAGFSVNGQRKSAEEQQ